MNKVEFQKSSKFITFIAFIKRLPLLYLIVTLLSSVYFLCLLFNNTYGLTILAFPVVFLIPGLLLLLLISKKTDFYLKPLLTFSFFISTILAVLIVSIFLLVNVPISYYSFGIFYIILNLFLVFFALIKKKPVKIIVSNIDYLILSLSLIAIPVLCFIFTSMPRFLTMDETSYIALSRYVSLNGETYPMGILPGKSDITYLFQGRFFWTLLITSFLSATGLQAYQATMIGTIFLPIIAITSTVFVPQNLKYVNHLQIAIFCITLSNPLLLLFSGFALNDIAMTYYLLIVILFFIQSFHLNDKTGLSISFSGLLMSVLALFIAFLIKPNVVIIFGMYLTLLFYLIRYKLYKISKTWKFLLILITFPVVFYEVFIDLPYVLSVWFIKNEAVSLFTSQFLLISPVETILGMFIPSPWNSTTLLSLGPYTYLDYLYRMLSPETLGLLITSIGLFLPLLFKLHIFHKNIQLRNLVGISTITLWFTYFLYLSANSFLDIPRFFLFMVPILVVIALIAISEVFFSRNIILGIAFTLPMILLIWVLSVLNMHKGGVNIGYGLPLINWTGSLIAIQLVIYILLMLLNYASKQKIYLSFRLKIFHKFSINTKKLSYSFLIIMLILSNVYFSVFSFSNSSLFKDNKAEYSGELLNDLNLPDVFIISNFYSYARPYVPDSLLRSGYFFPPPITEQDFLRLIKISPNNSFLIVSDDSSLCTYEYANTYIGKYIKTDIPIEPKNERVIYNDLSLDLRLGSVNNSLIDDFNNNNYTATVKGGVVSTGFFDEAIDFNGINEYAYVDNFSFSNEYSVEIWFKSTMDPSDFGINEDGTPVSKVLLAKRYHGYIELFISITNEGAVLVNAKNETGGARFNLNSPKGAIKSATWHQLILTVDANSACLYMDGIIVSKSNVNGLNQNLKDYTEAIGEPLKIGVDGSSSFENSRYFPGYIEDVRIYNRSLTAKEIADMYYGVKIVNSYDNIYLYKIENSFNLHENDDRVVIESAEFFLTNATNVRLVIKANSEIQEKLFIIIKTTRFSEVLTGELKLGENELIWDFKHRLENRDAYGLYFVSDSEILICAEDGQMLYNQKTTFTLSGIILASWIVILLILMCIIQFLVYKNKLGWWLNSGFYS